jgi:hypothetical protein
VTVASGEANWTIDFAFNLPSAPLAQFGDRVWVESDTDGLANTGVITPVAGMVIDGDQRQQRLCHDDDDAQGYYSFTVPAGTYTVVYGSVPSSYGSVVPSSTPGGTARAATRAATSRAATLTRAIRTARR